MEWKDAVGYDDFKTWEKDLARIKALRLVGQHGFTLNDADDLEAELRLHIWVKRAKYDPRREPRVTYETFMTRVVENKVRDIIETRHSQKRHPTGGLQSLETPIENRHGDMESVSETAPEEHDLWSRRRPAPEQTDLQIRMEKARQRLSEGQTDLFRLMISGFTVSEAAEKLGRPRTTLNKEIVRMRAIFGQEDLQDYL